MKPTGRGVLVQFGTHARNRFMIDSFFCNDSCGRSQVWVGRCRRLSADVLESRIDQFRNEARWIC